MAEPANTIADNDAIARLRILLIAVLAGTGILVLMSLLTLQTLLAGRQHDAHVAAMARGQTALVERMTKAAHRFVGVGSPAARKAALDELRDTLGRLQQVHSGLQNGSESLGLPGGNNARISQMYVDLERAYQAGTAAAGRILTAPDSQGELYQALQRLDDSESVFAGGMDAITAEYEAEAGSRVTTLRWLSLLFGVATLALLSFAAVKVIEPAIVRLRRGLLEREAQASETERLFVASPVALVLVDANSLAIVRASDTAVALTGHPADDLPGKPLSAHLDAGLEINRQVLARLRAGEAFDEAPILFVDAGNRAIDILASMRPVRHDGRSHLLLSLSPGRPFPAAPASR